MPRDFSILHLGKFYPPHNGGMETHLYDLAVRQAQQASVAVIVSNNAARWVQSLEDGVTVTRVPRLGTIASMPVCPSLNLAIRRSPADLVHIHVPNPGAALALLLSGHNGKIIVTHHADTLGRRALRSLSDPFVQNIMVRAEAIIATSSRYMESSEELRRWRHKCHVIPLGIDVEKHVLAPDTPAKVREIHNAHGERIIVAVGRLVPYKGFDVLIRAMKAVDGKLLLIGSGPLEQQLINLRNSEKLQSKIEILGRVEHIVPYYRAASVFILPSLTRAEAFGLVQVEAMAFGLPVINTWIDSGVPEVSVDGITGSTVLPGDPATLARAIQALLDNDALRHRLGKAARERVLTRYTADHMAEQTMSLYREILA